MSADRPKDKAPSPEPKAGKSPERILVGALAGAFGVRGEVRIKSFCADPEAIADYAPLWNADGSRSFSLKVTRQVPNGFAGRLDGVNSREEAEALKGTSLFADRDRLPSLPDDEFYHADLVGLAVLDSGGNSLGTVRAVLNHGAGDIIEIHQPGARQTMLLPFTLAFVPTVDLAAGRIIVDPPVETEDDEDQDQAEGEDDAASGNTPAAAPAAQRPGPGGRPGQRPGQKRKPGGNRPTGAGK